MSKIRRSSMLKMAALLSVLLVFSLLDSDAAIMGVNGPTFTLVARPGYISTPEGNSIYMWGFASGNGQMQYPGPTLIINEGDWVTVDLVNELDVPVSIIFPGQSGVIATGGNMGLVTREAAPGGGTVRYSFLASHVGTYQYHSGTDMEMQIEMGLVGGLIVRPDTPSRAYDHPDSEFDREIMMLFTEIDPIIHLVAEFGCYDLIDFRDYWPTYWFINGRCAPDTILPANASILPNQPYNCLPRIHPGERLLLRFICASRDLHPFHTHGNHFRVIARDGRLLESEPGAGTDLSELHFTLAVTPGGTADAIFTWTGEGLGWDIYGHSPGDPLEPNEYAPDHGKPFPVNLPELQDLTIGAAYSGSPFLGGTGFLSPGDGINNMYGGYFFMWHSHKEKEMVNNNVFPGGMMTFLIVEHPDVPINE